jgi:hypothetical protein
MPPRIRTALKVVAVGFFTLVFLIVYAVYTLTRPKQVFEFTSGRIGDLQLGETKEQILSRLSVGSTAAPAGKQVLTRSRNLRNARLTGLQCLQCLQLKKIAY